ncbi:MAG TPA: hypothetical protein VF777_07155 [Phycisphaerales bacterium]
MLTTSRRWTCAAITLTVAFISACDHKPAATPQPTPAPAPTPAPSGKEGHGATTALGEKTVGVYAIKASRDGDVTPGKDVPIDVWVTGTSKVAAVRFWIGTEDAKGSLKAKAELEKDNWHTHAEVPSPLPTGSQLWIEIESDTGEKTRTSFDLKNERPD